MNNFTSKSLEKYIEECVSKFDYFDFSPSSKTNLAEKFEKILHKENAYWDEGKPEDVWPGWKFIQFKSFTQSHGKILGLHFDKHKIILTLGNTFEEFALPQNNKIEINLFDIWLDHSHLFKKFLEVVKSGIDKSNPN